MNSVFISLGLLFAVLPWQLPENSEIHNRVSASRYQYLQISTIFGLPKILVAQLFPPKINLNLLIQEIISRLEGGQPTQLAIRESVHHHLRNIDSSLQLNALEQHISRLELPGLAAINAALIYSQILGTPMVEVLKNTAASITDMLQEKNRQENAISGPRISAQILAFLPLLGIGVGKILGADTLASFTDGKLGSFAFLTGIFLWFLGWLWWRKILAHVRGDSGL